MDKSNRIRCSGPRAGSNILAGDMRPAGAKEYRVTKTEIRRNVFGISSTNSETWQAQHG
jgi:hypothetical protein